MQTPNEFYADFWSPCFALDLADRHVRSSLERIQRRESRKVSVWDTEDRLAPRVSAIATRSADGASLYVVVTTAAGEQRHSWTWEFLQDTIQSYC